jgi:alkylglycerol monooxygenase
VPNYIALAVPFFFLLIGAELLLARRKKVATYRFNDTLVNLSCGTSQQVVAVFIGASLVALYASLWEHARFITFSASSPWTWVLAFVLVDFKYYWWHRASHEVNFMWAAHVVHHSSEDYNLAVALRQSVTTLVTTLPFALPLAVLGIPTVVFVTVESFSTLYQFWIHTELVSELGFFERIFNTPSQHRVHHAVNPRYLDKNYAATLCVWDRLFGTFEREREAPVYGLVSPLGNYNPYWAQVHYYVELWQMTLAAPKLRDKILVWLKGPTWRPEGMPACPAPPEVTPRTRAKYEPPIGAAMRGYLWLQLLFTIFASFFLMLFQSSWPRPMLIGVAASVGLWIFSWGGLLEKKSWAVPLELFRIGVLAAIAGWFLAPHLAAPVVALILAVALVPQLVLLWSLRGLFAQGTKTEAAA